jgi:hypothetical protein
MIDNPKQITPAALNLGIRAARGELVARCDARSRWEPDYLSQCVSWIEASGADNVGGSVRTLPRGGGLLARSIAAALGHRFGVGDSAFRAGASEPRWVDTVFGGCYRREVFRRVGEFNERLPRGQDLEFNLRLRRMGGRSLLVPAIRCDYLARCEARPFLAHAWTNGVWAVRPFAESCVVPVRPRHLVPLGFVVALGASVAAWLASWGAAPLYLLGSCYLAAAAAAAVQLARRHGQGRLVWSLPAVFLSLHLAYGLGSVWGVLSVAETLARRFLTRRSLTPAPGGWLGAGGNASERVERG